MSEAPVQTALVKERRVRVHQKTTRESRIYELEFTDGERSWSEPLWSVTTLLRSIDKPALPRWAAKAVATTAIRDRDFLAQDVARYGEREAISRLAESPYRQRSRAGDIGDAVHKLIDAHVLGGEPAAVKDQELHEAEVIPRFRQYERWEAAYMPAYAEDRTMAAEVTCLNAEHGWAGTLDQLAVVGTRGLGIIDVKNTNPTRDDKPGVYAEHGLQVCAYANADEVVARRGIWLEPLPMPKVEWGAVLWLHTEGYAFVEVNIDEEHYRAFRVAAELYRYFDGPGKRIVIGEQTPAVFGILPTPEQQAAAIAARNGGGDG